MAIARMDDSVAPMTPPAEPTRDEMIAWLKEIAQAGDSPIFSDLDAHDAVIARAIAARLKEDGA